jgi:hypothetical protein
VFNASPYCVVRGPGTGNYGSHRRGRFWKPCKDIDAILKTQASAKQPGLDPAGMDSALYQQRPPIDLTAPRLRKLAAALGPAYVRVSRTWANTTSHVCAGKHHIPRNSECEQCELPLRKIYARSDCH